MFEVKVIAVEDSSREIVKAAEKAAFRNLGHAAASIRKDAISTIEQSPGPSPPGTPPHTRRKRLPNAIAFDVTKTSAVIGPRYSIAGTSGEAHEIGGRYKKQIYPERRFMGPAGERASSRFAGEWSGSIGG